MGAGGGCQGEETERKHFLSGINQQNSRILTIERTEEIIDKKPNYRQSRYAQ
jgi:type IV secretory pathway ATPase VirB11/archaellum biosynthesis ATPase